MFDWLDGRYRVICGWRNRVCRAVAVWVGDSPSKAIVAYAGMWGVMFLMVLVIIFAFGYKGPMWAFVPLLVIWLWWLEGL